MQMRSLLAAALLAAALLGVAVQQRLSSDSTTSLLAPRADAATGAAGAVRQRRVLGAAGSARGRAATVGRRSAVNVDARHRSTHGVRRTRRAQRVLSGKAIFARMVTVLGKVAQRERGAAPKPPRRRPGARTTAQQAADVEKWQHDAAWHHDTAAKAFKQALALRRTALAAEADDEDGEIDVNDDPPANTVYVYRGRETKTKTDELVTFILAGGFGIPDIKYIESSSDADMRKALWDEDCRAVVFPPLNDLPDFGPNAVKDMRAYVSHGMHHSGTMLFMGSSVEVHLINNIFGYQVT